MVGGRIRRPLADRRRAIKCFISPPRDIELCLAQHSGLNGYFPNLESYYHAKPKYLRSLNRIAAIPSGYRSMSPRTVHWGWI